MKFLTYLFALSLLSTASVFAVVETKAKTKKAAQYTKVGTTKKALAKKQVISKTAKDRYSKAKAKMDTKTQAVMKKPVSKPISKKATTVKSYTKDRPATIAQKKTADQPSALQKAAEWIGLGTAGTAATKAYTTHKSGYHIGPRNWHDNFGPGWGDKGWVEGVNDHGNWVFAGYRPDWWQTHYPEYWKNVVGPLYRKSTEFQKVRK